MAMTDADASVFVATAPNHEETLKAVNHLWNNGNDLWINRQVLREYANVLTRPQTYMTPLPSAMVVNTLKAFTTRFQVADEDNKVTGHLWKLMENFPVGGKQIHDANIVATMQKHEIPYLLTFNPSDFNRYTSIITVLSVEDVLAE